MEESVRVLVKAIHASKRRFVVASGFFQSVPPNSISPIYLYFVFLVGAGSKCLYWLQSEAGASKSLIEANLPYSRVILQTLVLVVLILSL